MALQLGTPQAILRCIIVFLRDYPTSILFFEEAQSKMWGQANPSHCFVALPH